MGTGGRRNDVGLGDGLAFALFGFVVLALVGVILLILDFGEVNSQLRKLVTGYLLSSVLLGASMLAPRKPRAVLIAVSGAAAAASPVVAGWELVQSFGLQDLWIGQSWTLMVLFPLITGGISASLIYRS